MPIERMDHFTVLTKDAIATAEFYGSVLGLEPGPRPNFAFPGVWLYNSGRPILHVVEKDEIPAGTGVLDHMAFWGTDLAGFVSSLKARGIAYELRRAPEGGPATGVGSSSSTTPTASAWRSILPPAKISPSGYELGTGTSSPSSTRRVVRLRDRRVRLRRPFSVPRSSSLRR